jgi:hypothetical protein
MVNKWRILAKQLIQDVAGRIKLERLGGPHWFLAPVPYHFPGFSKLVNENGYEATSVKVSGLELDTAINSHRRKTIITVNHGAVVITWKPVG